MNNETLTSCIVHLADSANIEGVASNKRCNDLTGSCFESPNDTIHVTVMPNARDTLQTMNRHTKQMTENQRFVKLKEVQADTQSQRFCTTFNFTQTHNSNSNFYKKH